jgi:cytochrome c biogenesis protein CcmG/thiol:disulfide interchange protein DsbE
MSRTVRFAPLVLLFLFLIGLVWRLATPVNTDVPSRLEGKPVPSFELPAAVSSKPGLSSRDLATGQVRILNFFASWCVPCITEAGALGQLRNKGARIDGVAIRDRGEDVAGFLAKYGDAYERIGSDTQSRVQIALGSSGMPESFIIDGKGVVRYQHIGPIESSDVPTVMAALERAR